MTREELHSMIDDLFDKAEALKDKAEDAIDNADDKIEEAKILAEISAQDFENAIRRSVNKVQDAAVDAAVKVEDMKAEFDKAASDADQGMAERRLTHFRSFQRICQKLQRQQVKRPEKQLLQQAKRVRHSSRHSDRHSIPKTSKLPRIIKENHKTRY